ncbi:MAG: hypothetical protein EP329_14960 [Deltaproteobacteria bacterium]|nr:MAG: hypothetical protein EP329_14960 [Deltaproteobacteria bacterium]
MSTEASSECGVGAFPREVVARRGARARRFGTLGVLIGTLALGAGCPKRVIPARGDAPGVERFLEGGERVFEDHFERAELGPDWKTEMPYAQDKRGWRIENGWLHATQPENAGAWLMKLLPEGPTRVEFTARSEPKADGSFPGDLKCEIFATEPRHEAGYSVINGGWNNTLDVIARLGEHGKDRLAQNARPVIQSTAHRWAIVRSEQKVYFFRDGELVMTYTDEAPVPGRYFGFNNWASNAYFDDVAVYRLPGG